MGQKAEKKKKKKKEKIEKALEVGRRTREEIVKWNQMTALRFQTGERHQTSLASFRVCDLEIWSMSSKVYEKVKLNE